MANNNAVSSFKNLKRCFPETVVIINSGGCCLHDLSTMGKVRCFDILFSNNKTVYHPGEQVTGQCVLELKGDMKMRALRMFMRGVAKVHWTESRSTGTRLGAYTEHYNAEVEYFFKRQILFGGDQSDMRETLAEGRYEFNFSFELPLEGISTSFEGKHGSVRYWLKAEMDKPWSFNLKTKKAFTVISPIDINKVEYQMPVENNAEKTLCCWLCTSGPISVSARTDRRGYCPASRCGQSHLWRGVAALCGKYCRKPYFECFAELLLDCDQGESIAISAEFENYSSRTVIPYATLHQTQMFFANGKTRVRGTKFTILTGLPITPCSRASWDAQLLKIPAVSPSVMNCCVIRVEYYVKIALHIPGSNNLSMHLPIVVGTVPYRPAIARPPNDGFCGLHYLPVVPPPYRENPTPPPPIEDPPMYAESLTGAVDIRDEDDDQLGSVGDYMFTPMYTYVYDYRYRSPPAYSEVDPHPEYNCSRTPATLNISSGTI